MTFTQLQPEEIERRRQASVAALARHGDAMTRPGLFREMTGETK